MKGERVSTIAGWLKNGVGAFVDEQGNSYQGIYSQGTKTGIYNHLPLK